MLKTKQSINLTGQSIINIDGLDQSVVFMSANVSQNGGTPNISSTIQNQELYFANKAECKADMAQFGNLVDEMMEGLREDEV